MDQAVLNAQVRDASKKANNLRKEGLLLAEFYGKGEENVSLQFDYQEFRKLYREAGDNTVIDLKIEGGKDKKVLVQGVQYHPVSGEFMHIDFINVNMNEEVTANVPITLVGTAPAVKELAGTLFQALDELEIKCLPADLIHDLELDVSSLVDFHSALHVSDIKVPDSIEVLTEAERTVATVQAPREESEEEEGPTDVSEVGVVGEEKTEDAAAE